jgi:hypothetical protein
MRNDINQMTKQQLLDEYHNQPAQPAPDDDINKMNKQQLLAEYHSQPAQSTQPAQPDALHKYLINPTTDLLQGGSDYLLHGTTAPHGLLEGIRSALGGGDPRLQSPGMPARPDPIPALHHALQNVGLPSRPGDAATKVGEYIPGSVASLAFPEAEVPSLARAAITGAMGGALAPGQDPLSARNLAESAALGGALGQAGNLGRGLLSRLTRAKIGQTAEELNPEVMQGTRQPLQTPFMRGLAKVQGAAPFSGDRDFKQSLFDKVQDLDSQLKENPLSQGKEPNQQAYNDYKESYANAEAKTKNLYNQYAQAVDQKNAPFENSDYINALRDQLDKLNDATLGNPALIEAMQPEINTVNGFLSKPPKTFADAVKNEQGLNRLWRKNTGQDDGPIRDTIQQIKNSLQDSMDTTAQQHPELNDIYQKAKQARVIQGQFEKNIKGKPSEFIKQYGHPKADRAIAPPNFVQSVIKPSTATVDNTFYSKHLTDHLSDGTKQDIFNSLMQPKENMSLAQQLNKIGNYKDSQLQQLIGNKTGLLNQMKQLKSLSPEAMSPEFVPQTGLTGAKAALTGGAGGFSLHDPMAGLGMAGMAIGNRALNHVLRSEAFKNAAIRSLARRGTQNALSRYAPKFTGAITGSTGDNNGR